jgi:integrase
MRWKPPEVAEKVDRRVVANPRQVRELLTALTYIGGRDRDRGGRLAAMFAAMYHGALRPAEAVNLHKADCELPSTGWGRLYLSRTTPEVGRRYTDSAELHDDKGLKHRSEDEVRPVPIPPELVGILRAHIDRYGIAADGRLFRQSNGNVVGTSTYTQVWRAARLLALVPEQVAANALSVIPRISRDQPPAAASGGLRLHTAGREQNIPIVRCRRSERI